MIRRDWPIIVGGCHRSGTSLLRRLLNAHSRIHCGPEIKFFRDFHGDYANDPLWHLRFMATARTIVPEDLLLDTLGRAFVEVHVQAAALAGKPRWADKTPENVLHLSEWQRLLGDEWLFVHVVRNPLDTLASINEAGFPQTIPGDLTGRIAFYQKYTRAGLAFSATHPHRYLRVTYEDLVLSPWSALLGLMQWLGEELEPSQFDFNGLPQQSGVEDPKVSATTAIHSDSVGRWVSSLTPEEVSVIQRETADLWEMVGAERAAEETQA